MDALILYLLLGAFAGTVAGLLGVGGGLIIVPVLVFVFAGENIPPPLIMHIAIGTSLATIVVTSVSSMRAHHQHGAVIWSVFGWLSPGIVIGALLGAAIADQLSSQGLRTFFGIFELGVALKMGFGANPASHRKLPGMTGMAIAGVIIGTVSAIVGIGGGILTVPFLSWCNVSMRQAVATSAACGLPIALAGTVGFILTGMNENSLPEWSTGYVFWPAVAGVTAASMMFAPLGARLAHTLPIAILRRIFALFLAILGVRMLIIT